MNQEYLPAFNTITTELAINLPDEDISLDSFDYEQWFNELHNHIQTIKNKINTMDTPYDLYEDVVMVGVLGTTLCLWIRYHMYLQAKDFYAGFRGK